MRGVLHVTTLTPRKRVHLMMAQVGSAVATRKTPDSILWYWKTISLAKGSIIKFLKESLDLILMFTLTSCLIFMDDNDWPYRTQKEYLQHNKIGTFLWPTRSHDLCSGGKFEVPQFSNICRVCACTLEARRNCTIRSLINSMRNHLEYIIRVNGSYMKFLSLFYDLWLCAVYAEK